MEHLILGCGGNWSADFRRTFDELCVHFPDLTQEAATVDEEILAVDSETGYLEVEAETSGEMYVTAAYL